MVLAYSTAPRVAGSISSAARLGTACLGAQAHGQRGAAGDHLVQARTAFSKSKLGLASTSSWPSSPHSRAAASTAAAHSGVDRQPMQRGLAERDLSAAAAGVLISSA